MRIFDAHLDSARLSEQDLENLAYFDTRTALVAAARRGRNDTAADLVRQLREVLDVELVRLERQGITGLAALGVHPESAPRRTFDAAWPELVSMAAHPAVVAIGELELRDEPEAWELARRQLALAAERQLPVLASTPAWDKGELTERASRLAAEVGLPARQLVVQRVDYTNLRLVLELGHVPSVCVGPLGLAPADAAEMLLRYGAPALERAIVSSGPAEGSIDVLAIPRLVLALRDRGLEAAQVERLVWRNARRTFGLEASPKVRP